MRKLSYENFVLRAVKKKTQSIPEFKNFCIKNNVDFVSLLPTVRNLIRMENIVLDINMHMKYNKGINK